MQKYYNTIVNAQTGVPVAGAQVTVKTNPGGVVATIYSDNGVTPTSNPVSTDGNGLFFFYAADGHYDLVVSYSGATQVTVTDQILFDNTATTGAGSVITINSDSVQAELNTRPTSATLAASGGAGLIGFKQPDTGSIASTVAIELQSRLNAKTDFGCVGDNVADDSAAMLAFFTACISSGKRGYIPPGNYSITLGTLAFDTPFVDATFPIIETAGEQAVIFTSRAGSPDAPFISLTNGTATSPAGRYWRGGYLGGIFFKNTIAAGPTNSHGLQLRGVYGTTFGWLRGDDLNGDTVNIPQSLYLGNNPDPYAISLCRFTGIEGNRNTGWVFNNQNYVGFNGCEIDYVRGINTVSGGFFGIGAGNRVGLMSLGECQGWAFDDGTNLNSTGGSPSRFLLQAAEIDGCQNGVRLNKGNNHILAQVRFVCRYQFSPNTTPFYWPLTCIDICGGSSPNLFDVTMGVWYRVEAGGTKPTLGKFLDGHSSGAMAGISINMKLDDNAGLGLVNTDLFTGVTTSSQLIITRDLIRINDTIIKPFINVNGSAGTVIGSNPLTNNPITTTNTSNDFSINIVAHGVVVGQIVTLSGVTAVGGFTANQLNTSFAVKTVTDADNIILTAIGAAATSSTTGGGAAVVAKKNQSWLQSGGDGTPNAKVAFPTAGVDRDSLYSVTTYEYTVPWTGSYRINAQVAVGGLAAGNRVILSAYRNLSTAPVAILSRQYRAQGANTESVSLSGLVSTLTQGDKVSITATTNAAPGLAMALVTNADTYWSIEPM